MTRLLAFCFAGLCAALPPAFTQGAEASDGAFAEDFEETAQVPAGWTTEGAVTISTGETFQGAHALVLSKTEATQRDRTVATGPAFDVKPGTLEIGFSATSDLSSPDNSYNGTLTLEFSDTAGRSLGSHELGAWFRKSPWKTHTTQVQVPDQAATARLVASINKETPGTFAIDVLSAKLTVDGDVDDGLRRMMFTMPQIGHMLFPSDPREAEVEVWSTKELPDKLRTVACTVRDYWGAEQNRPIQLTLTPAGKVSGTDYCKYTAKVDLSKIPLSIGRYYELQGEIARPQSEAFTHHTSFAILPEAAANQYPPEDIPFTSRTWDQRFKESPLLTHRLGIRMCNVWATMSADPAKVDGTQIDLCHELGLGVLTSSPAQGIEGRWKGWETLLANDGEKLRQGVRNFFSKYGHIRPMVVNLGNEPHNKGEAVKADVEAYRIVYQEIKKIDPSVFVVGTSIGVEQEDYFRFGFGEWCDAYDFHSYEDPEGVRTILAEKYPAMFKKYGFAKPVWSTEIGMNSQGMTRQAVASLVYKKFANFFAGGGANVSWFGLFYPDPDGKISNSFASAHNVFDCRYNKYAPKLDAIAYFNAVNGIAIKKFVEDKVYDNGAHLFLFRDRDERSLIIGYRNSGRSDVFLPLPGVKSAQMIRLDGSRDQLDADNKGVAFTVDENPRLLFYENGPKSLPPTLEASSVGFGVLPEVIRRDGENVIEAVVEGIAPEKIDLQAPPFWIIRRTIDTTANGKQTARFAVTVAPDSKLREADLTLRVRGNGADPVALFSLQVPVADLLSVELLPVATSESRGTGVKLVVQNNSAHPQALTWTITLHGEQTLKAGSFSRVVEPGAKLSGPTSGVLALEGGAVAEVILPIAAINPYAVYHVKATVRDESGRMVARERPVSGFVAVHKTAGAMKIDGILDEREWAQARVSTLDQADQFYGFQFGGKERRVWRGPEDLSAKIRYLWDDRFLYVAVSVKDDVAGSAAFENEQLWRTDGLQFLIDPMRRSDRKSGKYEYCIGRGRNGVQAWCTLSADARAPAGAAKSIEAAIHRDKKGTGDVTYEVAIPWARLAPFRPSSGNNLGLTLIVNDDDGAGRDSFMTWFGNTHNKDVDTVGDLILLP